MNVREAMIEAFVDGAHWEYWRKSGSTFSGIEKQTARDAAPSSLQAGGIMKHVEDSVEKQDCDTPTGTQIRMTTGVHCCECWKHSDADGTHRQRIVTAAVILESSGLKSTPIYAAAEAFLKKEFSL